MSVHLLAATAALFAIAIAGPIAPVNAGALFGRQMNADSTCSVFGVDFQNGGSYFININSTTQNTTAQFMLVEEFEGCNNDTASLMLVNDDTGGQYYCTSIPTVLDDVPQMSTCPVQTSQLVSGNYSIISLGNNGNGNPFAVQRDFSLSVGVQQTITVTISIPYTVIVQPTSTVSYTSTAATTTSIVQNNNLIIANITSAQTAVQSGGTATQTEDVIRTFTRWTVRQSTAITVATVSCSIPSKARYPDGPCRIIPTGIPLPQGIKIQTRDAVAEKQAAALGKRTADPATITSTTSVPSNSTVTSTLSPVTTTTTVLTTDTVFVTLPANTTTNVVVDTITATTALKTNKVQRHTVTYVTKTMSVVWTSSTTTTPAASASACKRAGGNFGNSF